MARIPNHLAQKGTVSTVYKWCVAIAILLLALPGPIKQCEAWPWSEPDAFTRLDNWLVKRPDRPSTTENPDNSSSDHIKFIQQWSVTGHEELKHPKVNELVDAIANLDPNQDCTYENLLATKHAKTRILKGDDEALSWPKSKRPLADAMKRYFNAIRNCYTKFDIPISDFSCRFIDNIILGELATDNPEYSVVLFDAVIDRKRAWDAKKRPFSGDNILEALRHAHEERTGVRDFGLDEKGQDVILNKSKVVQYINEYLIEPCKEFVPKHAEQLDLIVLLASFEHFSRLVENRHVLRVASRYLSCKMLLDTDLDELATVVVKARRTGLW